MTARQTASLDQLTCRCWPGSAPTQIITCYQHRPEVTAIGASPTGVETRHGYTAATPPPTEPKRSESQFSHSSPFLGNSELKHSNILLNMYEKWFSNFNALVGNRRIKAFKHFVEHTYIYQNQLWPFFSRHVGWWPQPQLRYSGKPLIIPILSLL